MIRDAEYYNQVRVGTVEIASDAAFIISKTALRARQEAIREGRLVVVASIDDIPGGDPSNPDGCVGCTFTGPQYCKTGILESHPANGGWAPPPTSTSFDPTNAAGMNGWIGGVRAFERMQEAGLHQYPNMFVYPKGMPQSSGLTHKYSMMTFNHVGTDADALVISTKEPEVLKQFDGECEKPSPGASCQEKVGCEVQIRYRFRVYYHPLKWDGALPTLVLNSSTFGLSNVTPTHGNDTEVLSGKAWYTVYTDVTHTLACGEVFQKCISPFALSGQGGFAFTIPSMPSITRTAFDSNTGFKETAFWMRLICNDCKQS